MSCAHRQSAQEGRGGSFSRSRSDHPRPLLVKQMFLGLTMHGAQDRIYRYL